MSLKWFASGLVLLISLSLSTLGQTYYRIECDISIKSKVQGGQGSLTLGRVFYDRTAATLVYSISFPEREVWVVRDTLSLVYRNGELLHSSVIGAFTHTTMFHKSLVGSLNDFGLSDSHFTIDKVERDQNMVITTWTPPQMHSHLGRVITSTVGNNLYGVVVMNPQGEIISRQVYKNYLEVRGLMVPTEVIQIAYRDSTEVYQIINLSNIIINNPGNEEMYHYAAGSN